MQSIFYNIHIFYKKFISIFLTFFLVDISGYISPWTVTVISAISWKSGLHKAAGFFFERWRMSSYFLGRISGKNLPEGYVLIIYYIFKKIMWVFWACPWWFFLVVSTTILSQCFFFFTVFPSLFQWRLYEARPRYFSRV